MTMRKNRRKLWGVLRLLPLLLLTALLLGGCGKKGEEAGEDDGQDTGPRMTEIQITGANFYDYFDYKEYPNYSTDEDGVINACNLSYGFSLHEGLTAVNDGEHESTLQVSFTADGVAQYGEFDVDFKTLSFTGSEYSRESEVVSETLAFWPQGNRTVSYPYGTISSSYIIRLYNFKVTAVSGTVWLWLS